MKILSIGTDRKLFEEGSAVRSRIIEYGRLFDELHVVVFALKSYKLQATSYKLSDNVFVYSTNSSSRFFYIFDAIRLGKKIIFSESYKLPATSYQLTCQDPFETGLVGWRLAKRFKLPLELQIHTDIGSPYFTSVKLGWRLASLNFVRFWLARFLLPRADKIRVVSVRIKSFLVSELKITENKIEIRPIKIDETKIKNTVVLPENDLRKKYPRFNFIALVAGRFEPEKNFALAIDVWREIVKKFPRAGLIIVGSGSLEKNLKRKVKSEKLEENIIFEQWKGDLIPYYKTANVLLNTSFYEGYGMAMAEAKVAGLPIISTDVGAVNEIFQSGKKVTICPVEDKNCLVAGIV